MEKWRSGGSLVEMKVLNAHGGSLVEMKLLSGGEVVTHGCGCAGSMKEKL